MELLTLLPMLLKMLPIIGLGIVMLLWRRAVGQRNRAKEEVAAFKGSYELAEEVKEIKKQEDGNVAAIENLDLSGVVNALRGILRVPGPKN